MQKKKIILLTVLILIIVGIIALALSKPKQVTPMKMTATAEYSTKIGQTDYDITNLALAPSEIVPIISAGMIPIKADGEYWTITTVNDTEWYDYSNSQLAYIMLSDGYYKSELERGVEDEQLMQNSVGASIARPEDLGTIYMYIPRFAYNDADEIIYIKQCCSVAGTWKIPEIFTYETNSRDFSLAGIWVEYNPLENEDEVIAKIEKMNKEDNRYGLIANTIATNANNETSYKTTIETFITNIVGADASVRPLLIEQENQNRTILKIINTNKLEPIKGKATLDEETLTITINISYTTNGINKIIDENWRELSTNSTIATDKIIEESVNRYFAIDKKGNIKEIEIDKIFVIYNLARLNEFRDRVNAGDNFAGVKVFQTVNIDMSSVCSEELGSWEPIGVGGYNFSGDENKCFAGTYDRNVSYNKQFIYKFR